MRGKADPFPKVPFSAILLLSCFCAAQTGTRTARNHRYFSVVRDQRVSAHKTVRRTVLYLDLSRRLQRTSNGSGQDRAELTCYLQPECVSGDRKSTRLNSSHLGISYAVF